MQIYRATNQFRSKQLGSQLSKQLRKKYGRRSIRIVIGDTVKIIRGVYKGIDGKVTKISLAKNSIAVEGIQREKLKGGKVDQYIHSSNAMITSLNTEDKWRVKILEHKPKSKIKSMKADTKPEEKTSKNKIKKTPKKGEN
ncbi:50S ribosomal protein L24P [Marine Group I thaumarchaeote SCGC AAA799-O18]|jgi:large subunit ribosomal protein L24|nr:50S ribosomal protein L24P [Marine Group I thaumarchaeote SCGC AAA799-O18]